MMSPPFYFVDFTTASVFAVYDGVKFTGASQKCQTKIRRPIIIISHFAGRPTREEKIFGPDLYATIMPANPYSTHTGG
jgi:hypothetical protein